MLEPVTRRARSTRGARHAFVDSAAGLSRIHRASLDVCVWRRTVDASLARWLDEVAKGSALSIDERNLRARDVKFDRWLGSLAASAEKQAFVDDLELVLAAAVRVNGDVPLRVQLSTIDSRKCPRFHIDNVGVRLLCTYAGAGTEWIPEAAVDREHLRTCSADHAPLRAGGAVEHLKRFDVVLMKGTAFPGNARFGAVHRSPDVRGAPRIVFTVDTQHPPTR